MPEKRRKFGAKQIALVAIMAATMSCGKLALAVFPNIEVVMLLCALYGYVFGFYGVAAAAVFVCIEPLIYGIGSWMLTYFLFWPGVALLFMLFGSYSLRVRRVSRYFAFARRLSKPSSIALSLTASTGASPLPIDFPRALLSSVFAIPSLR